MTRSPNIFDDRLKLRSPLRDVFESDAGSAATLAVVEEEAEDVDDVGPDDWAHGRDLPEDACAIIFVPRAPGAADPDPDADPGVDLGTAATPLELVGTCPGTGSFVFDRCWFTIGTMTMLLHRRDAGDWGSRLQQQGKKKAHEMSFDDRSQSRGRTYKAKGPYACAPGPCRRCA